MFRNIPILAILAVVYLCHCTPQEEDITVDPQAMLTFSTDTLFFDTLFTDTTSFTRRFRVFNPQKNALRITDISLQQAGNSSYSLTVNGVQAESFQDQIILGEDSLLVLVTVFIPSRGEDTPFLVEDAVQFLTNGNQQQVQLVAWGQEANFFQGDSILTCNTIWTNDKPYVLYGSVLVDSLCTLTIEAGSQIYVNQNAAMLVAGSLEVQGTPQDPVLFSNVRLDLENSPGQWIGLVFLQGSQANSLDHAIIRNAEFGVRIGTPDNDTLPDLVVSNSIIENMSTFGILAFTSDLLVYNTVVDNCIDYATAHFAGGHYQYQHCTIANYSVGIFSEQPAAIFTDNLILADGSELIDDLYVRIQNSILWGNFQQSEELILNTAGGAFNDILVSHVMLRSSDDIFNINNNILDTDPDFPQFIDPFNFDFRLDTLSPAQDQGLDLMINKDLLGNDRDSQPDLGAYERIE